jgi:hypothetical protein
LDNSVEKRSPAGSAGLRPNFDVVALAIGITRLLAALLTALARVLGLLTRLLTTALLLTWLLTAALLLARLLVPVLPALLLLTRFRVLRLVRVLVLLRHCIAPRSYTPPGKTRNFGGAFPGKCGRLAAEIAWKRGEGTHTCLYARS